MKKDKGKDQNQNEIMANIVVKAWTDPEFVEMLKKNPRRALEEEGFEFEKGGDVKVQFHFDTKKTKNIIIPNPPDLLSLGKADLLAIAAQILEIQLELF